MTWMIASLIAMALAQIADVITTLRALARPGVHEANPVIAWAMARFGRGWIVVKTAMAIGPSVWFWVHDLWWPILLIAALTGAVAWHNYKITSR